MSTVFVAEDDPDDLFLLKKAMGKLAQAHTLEVFRNGRDLLAALKSEPAPALVILDLNLPIVDGREALRAMQSHKVLREIPVLIFTTSALDSDRQQTLGLGAKYFLTKPASIQGYLDSLTPVIEDILSPCRGHIS